MNIFMENEDYLKDVSLDSILEADKEFFAVMRKIRERLGDKQYWIDNYVKKTLEAINCQLAYEYADMGFEEFGSLRSICTEVLNGGGDVENPIYSIVKNAINRYATEFQERETLRSIAAIVAFPEFMKIATKQFVQEESDDLSAVLDNLKQQELFRNISVIVGEREMEHLNAAIKRRFLIVPATNNYLQGLINDYLYCFLHRDKETERLVFQILFDEDTE